MRYIKEILRDRDTPLLWGQSLRVEGMFPISIVFAGKRNVPELDGDTCKSNIFWGDIF